jgi:hypothetical protein
MISEVSSCQNQELVYAHLHQESVSVSLGCVTEVSNKTVTLGSVQ